MRIYIAAILSVAAFSSARAEESNGPLNPPVYVRVVFSKNFPTITQARKAIDEQEKEVEALVQPVSKAPFKIYRQSGEIRKESNGGQSTVAIYIETIYWFSDAAAGTAVADMLSLQHFRVGVVTELDEDRC